MPCHNANKKIRDWKTRQIYTVSATKSIKQTQQPNKHQHRQIPMLLQLHDMSKTKRYIALTPQLTSYSYPPSQLTKLTNVHEPP